MEKPKFIKATDGNCGMYAINMALNGLKKDINADEIIEIALENGLSISGELYTTEAVKRLVEILNEKHNVNLNLNIVEFSNEHELKGIIEENIENAYILLPYYAFQGAPVTSKKPDMKRGHWGIIYDIQGDKVYGKQSNSKADILGALDGVSVNKLFKSNSMLYNIKVNMGRYNKCTIKISKKQLEEHPRCGENICELSKGRNNVCIFNSDLSGKAFILN